MFSLMPLSEQSLGMPSRSAIFCTIGLISSHGSAVSSSEEAFLAAFLFFGAAAA